MHPPPVAGFIVATTLGLIAYLGWALPSSLRETNRRTWFLSSRLHFAGLVAGQAVAIAALLGSMSVPSGSLVDWLSFVVANAALAWPAAALIIGATAQRTSSRFICLAISSLAGLVYVCGLLFVAIAVGTIALFGCVALSC